MASIPDPNEVFDQYAVEPLTAPIEFIPDDMPEELDEASDTIKIWELGRKIGAMQAEHRFFDGWVAGVEDALKPCQRKHRGRRVRGLRPRTYGVHR